MATTTVRQRPDDIIYPDVIPWLLMHVACLGAIWTGVSGRDLIICFVLYFIRMFGVTGGLHRYFSHRAFKTSRVGQFLLAWLAQSAAQQDVVWWAAKHRAHHKYSDTPQDPHSPRQYGFWFAHFGWIFSREKGKGDLSLVPDLMAYPELRFLHRHKLLPALSLALVTFYFFGWSGLIVGFFWSTVLVYHVTFMINSIAHVVGNQRYVSGDDSRNNWWLGLLAMGEGWHNNHHYFQSAARQGFFWWEIDISYYILKILSWFGLVWDLKQPPAAVIKGERRLSKEVINKAAADLAYSFPVSSIAEQFNRNWETLKSHLQAEKELAPQMKQIIATAAKTEAPSLTRTQQFLTWLQQLHLPHIELPQLPTLEEIKTRAQKMYSSTPSLEDIVARAHEMILQALPHAEIDAWLMQQQAASA